MVCIQLIALIPQIPNMLHWVGENDDTLLTENQKTIPNVTVRESESPAVLWAEEDRNTHSYNLL